MEKHPNPDSPRSSPGYTFEWHFSNYDWVFYEGQAQDSRFVRSQGRISIYDFFRELPVQPLLLRTRSIEPVTAAGHHHHTDYTIYYYSEGVSANRHDQFDNVALCFAGRRHKFFQLNITDIDGTGRRINEKFQDAFYKSRKIFFYS